MRRYIPALLLVLTAFAPIPLTGCDLIKKLKGDTAEDAAAEAAAPVAEVVDAAPAAEVLDAAPALTPTTTATAAKVVTKPTDAGVTDASVADAARPADASAAIADAAAQIADAAAQLTRDGGPRIIIPRGLIKKAP